MTVDRPRRAEAETPLILYTWLVPISVGLSATRWLFAVTGPDPQAGTGAAALLDLYGWANPLLLIIAGVVSLAHLSQPLRLWRLVANPRSSWLSREGILFGVYTALVLLLTPALSLPEVLLPAVSSTASLLGVVLLLTVGALYRSTAIPGWNTPSTLVVFLLSGVSAAILLTGMVQPAGAAEDWQALGVVAAYLCQGISHLLLRFGGRTSSSHGRTSMPGLNGGRWLSLGFLSVEGAIVVLALLTGSPGAVVALFVVVAVDQLHSRMGFFGQPFEDPTAMEIERYRTTYRDDL